MAIPELTFTASDRVLVFAPHPDDETLACGGLIQQVLAARASLRVLLATDGDNNPWPQRWLERCWHIGPNERARWGTRRREEAKAALALLGVADSQVHCFGWPDQGLTAALFDRASLDQALRMEISVWSPSHIVLPALSDRHPDHSASRVLLELSLENIRIKPLLVEYLVHGHAPLDGQSALLPLDPVMRQRKQQAVLVHRSQISLSRGRMLAQVQPFEHFQLAVTPSAAENGDLPWRVLPALHSLFELFVVHAGAAHRYSLEQAPVLCKTNGRLKLSVSEYVGKPSVVFVKLQTKVHSPWIFDYWGWRRLQWNGAGESLLGNIL